MFLVNLHMPVVHYLAVYDVLKLALKGKIWDFCVESLYLCVSECSAGS